jgi:transposase
MGADCSFLAGKPGDPGRPAANNRLFREAVLRIARTGASRRDLPDPFALWNSVFRHFGRWTLKGVCRIGEFFHPGRARRELFSALS